MTLDVTAQNQYLYDGDGRICAVASVNNSGFTVMTGYLYDAGGTRVAKGTITVWSCDPGLSGFSTTNDYILGLSGEQVTEMGAGGATTGSTTSGLVWKHTNVWAAGKLLATYDDATVNGTVSDPGLHFYFDDPLGTRRVQTDSVGNIENKCSSLPFGDGETCASTPTEHLFTGKERDTESGNDYFGARYYASSMGRWMSPDWANGAEAVPYGDFSDPQSLNLYSYVRNNPLTRSDPDGHCDVDGEHHWGWCIWHDLGFYQTQVDRVNEARNFFANNNVMIDGNHVDPTKLSDQQVLASFKSYNDAYRANGGAQNPNAALAGLLPGAGLKYEANPKHGATASGNISAEPTNPEATLKNSVSIKNTSTARVGVDPATGEYVMFRETGTGTGTYHGYAVKDFNSLPNEAKSALQNAGMVSQRGKIL